MSFEFDDLAFPIFPEEIAITYEGSPTEHVVKEGEILSFDDPKPPISVSITAMVDTRAWITLLEAKVGVRGTLIAGNGNYLYNMKIIEPGPKYRREEDIWILTCTWKQEVV